MRLSKAVEGFAVSFSADDYSPNTIGVNSLYLSRLVSFLQDPQVEIITLTDLQKFIIYLQTDYVPQRFGGNHHPVRPSTINNAWAAISSF